MQDDELLYNTISDFVLSGSWSNTQEFDTRVNLVVKVDSVFDVFMSVHWDIRGGMPTAYITEVVEYADGVRISHTDFANAHDTIRYPAMAASRIAFIHLDKSIRGSIDKSIRSSIDYAVDMHDLTVKACGSAPMTAAFLKRLCEESAGMAVGDIVKVDNFDSRCLLFDRGENNEYCCFLPMFSRSSASSILICDSQGKRIPKKEGRVLYNKMYKEYDKRMSLFR